ncbi:hypothetical protein HPB48_000040 [Haemaphysalis longicornis]|uniref:Uncharacterized protein n=1 Tax=Haemaphysalis longicornis TaxID=44386 RepID=A0A9J6G950_HAELO|nr:hypothetical protein HPB48_000040 [Haemaphysalis longicornis]
MVRRRIHPATADLMWTAIIGGWKQISGDTAFVSALYQTLPCRIEAVMIGAPDELMESPMADDNVIRLSWYQGLTAKAFFYLVQDEGYASRLAEDTFNLENDIALALLAIISWLSPPPSLDVLLLDHSGTCAMASSFAARLLPAGWAAAAVLAVRSACGGASEVL